MFDRQVWPSGTTQNPDRACWKAPASDGEPCGCASNRMRDGDLSMGFAAKANQIHIRGPTRSSLRFPDPSGCPLPWTEWSTT